METIIVTTESAIERIIERIIECKFPEPATAGIEKTYSINQVAKMLKRSHKKISDLVTAGILKVTPDRRIYESSIKEPIGIFLKVSVQLIVFTIFALIISIFN